jgi:predicted Fe-Mo cluster-binding NifX family protein
VTIDELKKKDDKLKVAVSATAGSLDAQIDPRFGRCQYFVIVDTETMNLEALPNMAAGAMGGAGVQAAQMVANRGVQAVLTGSVGPNAFQALSAAGINIITGVFGTVKEAVEKFKSGQLQKITAPTAPMGFGMGGGYGMGMGMGRGGGRGIGRGMGRGYQQATGPFAPQAPISTPVTPPIPPQMSKEQEIQMLENQMKTIQKQLDQIRKRLKELKK